MNTNLPTKMTQLNQLLRVLMIQFGLIICINVQAQGDTIIYDNEVYVDYVQGLTFHIEGLQTSFPIISLDNGRLQLAFDDMGGSFYDYTYRIIHCDKDWRRSDISEIEYLDGFNGELIEEFTTSEFTYIDYTHYTITIPNQDIRLKISGNYLLVVFDEDGLPIISRRFIVVNPQIAVEANLRKSQEIGTLNTHHGVQFKLVDKENYISNPNDETFVRMLQNGRWDSGYHNLRPDNTLGQNIIFNTNRPYSFPGLKEFRNFDIRNLEAATRHVHSVDLSEQGTKAILELSKNRQFGNYVQDNDANGFFVIDNQNDRQYQYTVENHHRGAITGDYVDVYFTLKTKEIYDKEVYVIGGFSDWKIKEEYRMEYLDERKLYLGNAFFKQGYYDYFYAAVDPSGEIDIEILEGNNFNTENDYLIIVYNRAYGKNYDEVIAIHQINSLDNQ